MASKILVVDDDETIRGLLLSVLQGSAHEVVCAENGALGLTALRMGEFDLMITDLHMPVMDGYTLIPKALTERPGLPIIVLSSDTSLSSIDQVYKNAVKAFLPKPFEDVFAVAKKVQDVLELASSHRELRSKLTRAQEMLKQAASDASHVGEE